MLHNINNIKPPHQRAGLVGSKVQHRRRPVSLAPIDKGRTAAVPKKKTIQEKEDFPKEDPLSPEQSFSVELLTQGCVHAFVEFFELTQGEKGYIQRKSRATEAQHSQFGDAENKNTPLLSSGMARSDSRRFPQRLGTATQSLSHHLSTHHLYDEKTIQNLRFLKENLMRAEKAWRTGDVEKIIDSYQNMSSHFISDSMAEKEDLEIALTFLRRTIDIAKQNDQVKTLALAYKQMGEVYERKESHQEATKCFEQYWQIAKESGLEDVKKEAEEQLTQTYSQNAGSLHVDDPHKAIVSLERCVEMARACGDKAAEADAHYSIGQAHLELEDFERAVDCFAQHRKIATELGDLRNETKALEALARAYQGLGDLKTADELLHSCCSVARETGDQAALCRGCTRLGILANRQHCFAKAVEYLTQAFELAQTLALTKEADRARVHLGIAVGNTNFERFLKTVVGPLPQMLAYKAGCDPTLLSEK
eukprot:GCRY01002628.1.p1 GENE.GCRY01002628.1~~GCRY01002628.1.p1  ORF type:complete len:478 (+),score=117.05 GCRY01002628.1:260-1693(+)